jgi:hypothetical protein
MLVNDLLLFSEANLTPPNNDLGKAIEMAWAVHQKPIKTGDTTLGLGWHLMGSWNSLAQRSNGRVPLDASD